MSTVAEYDTTITMSGARLTLPWFEGDALKAYALGHVTGGFLHYVVVDSNDGTVTTYRANDQSFPALHDSREVWDMPHGMIHALYQASIREFANSRAEDQRYRENVELREQLAQARVSNSRESIMREMMEKAAEIAESEGFCSEYDRLADALGYEGRERDWTVNVEIESFTVSVSVRATSADAACDSVDESEVDDAIRHFIGHNSVSWSTDGAERD